MLIDKIIIQAGDKLFTVKDRSIEDPLLIALHKEALSSSTTFKIKVEPTPSILALIDTLASPERDQVLDPRLTALSRELTSLAFSKTLNVRILNLFYNKKLVYVWQVARLQREEFERLRGFGRAALEEVERVLQELGTGFGVEIQALHNLLPEYEKYKNLPHRW